MMMMMIIIIIVIIMMMMLMGTVQPCALGHFCLLLHHWAISPLLSSNDDDFVQDNDDNSVQHFDEDKKIKLDGLIKMI